jgi:hypothetical protein
MFCSTRAIQVERWFRADGFICTWEP